MIYSRSLYPDSLTERCRAEITRRDGSLARCGNRVSDRLGGLCWRHR